MNEFFELDEHQKKAMEKAFRSYPYLDRMIAIRQSELDIRLEEDENIGGGRSPFISKPTESVAIKRQSDPHIQHCQKLKRDIEFIISEMDEETKQIAHKRFWDNANYYTWEDLATDYHYSKSTIYRKRDKILFALAHRQGLI